MADALNQESESSRFRMPLIVALLVYAWVMLGERDMLGDPDTYWHDLSEARTTLVTSAVTARCPALPKGSTCRA